MFQPCTSLAYLPSERRTIRTARGRAAHLYSPVCPQGDASGSRGRTPSPEDPTGRSTSSPTRSWAAAPGPPRCPRAGMGVAAGPLQAISRDAGARNALHSQASLAPFRSPSGFHSSMAVGRPLSCRQRNRRTQSKADPSVQLHLVSPCGTDLTHGPLLAMLSNSFKSSRSIAKHSFNLINSLTHAAPNLQS